MLCSRLFAPRSFITRRHFRITTMIDPNLDLPALPTGHIRITEGSATMDYDEKEAVFYNKVQVFNRDLSIQVVKLFSEIREKEKKERYDKKYNNFLQAKERALAAGYQSQTEIRAKCHPLDTEMETIEVYVDPNAPLSSDKDISKDSKILRPPRPYREGISVLDALAATGLRSIRYMKEIPLIRSMVINDLIEDATIAAAKNCSQNQVDMSRVTINHGDAIEYMIQHADVEKQQQFDVIDLGKHFLELFSNMIAL
jgi:tRNA (guanine26-N2/guanine27-N2)-dimethyltransferase